MLVGSIKVQGKAGRGRLCRVRAGCRKRGRKCAITKAEKRGNKTLHSTILLCFQVGVIDLAGSAAVFENNERVLEIGSCSPERQWGCHDVNHK